MEKTEITGNEPKNELKAWPDEMRQHANGKSQYYLGSEKVYVYGFYDAYQIQNRKLIELIDALQNMVDLFPNSTIEQQEAKVKAIAAINNALNK